MSFLSGLMRVGVARFTHWCVSRTRHNLRLDTPARRDGLREASYSQLTASIANVSPGGTSARRMRISFC
jgi:hypothetical protein